MAVYNKSGISLAQVFNESGLSLAKSYDKYGNEIFTNDGSFQIRAMSFNVFGWSGINADAPLMASIINRYNPDIIGFQETDSRGPTFQGSNVVSNSEYPYFVVGLGYLGSSIASRFLIEDYTSKAYNDQDNLIVSAGYKRAYQIGYVTIGGKRIAIINTHLEVESRNPTVWVSQMQELYALASEQNSFILTGDFNLETKDKTSARYISAVKPFEDNFNMANWGDSFVDTWFSGNTPSTSNKKYPHDNIITSNDITISNVVFDQTKITADEGLELDHIPIVATLSFVS